MKAKAVSLILLGILCGFGLPVAAMVPDLDLDQDADGKDLVILATGFVTTVYDSNDLADFAAEYGGFAIQEADSFWSGIVVRGVDDLTYGNLYRLTGTVMERDPDDPDKWAYMTYLEIDDPQNVEDIGRAEVPEPMDVQIRDMRFTTNAEHLEGMLIRIRNFEIGLINVVDELRGIYFPITDAGVPDENKAWMTTYGLSDADKEELEIDRFTEGTAIESLAGIFVENETYAIDWQMREESITADMS